MHRRGAMERVLRKLQRTLGRGGGGGGGGEGGGVVLVK